MSDLAASARRCRHAVPVRSTAVGVFAMTAAATLAILMGAASPAGAAASPNTSARPMKLFPTTTLPRTNVTSISSATTGPSSPSTTGTAGGQAFAAAQKEVETQLSNRESKLSELTAKTGSAEDLSATDRTTLQSLLSNETSGIDALAAKVPSDTTMQELTTDAESMVDDYRVYLVMSPQVNLTIAADVDNSVESKLIGDESQIQSAISTAESKGVNVSGAEAAFTNLESEVQSASGLTANLPGQILAATPQGYPGNQSVFTSAISAIRSATTDLETAASDLRTIQEDLRSSAVSATTTTNP